MEHTGSWFILESGTIKNYNYVKAASPFHTIGPSLAFCWINLLPTYISSSDNLLHDLLSESTQHSLHNHVVVSAGCESYQGGGGGCSRQLDLNKHRGGTEKTPSHTDRNLEIFISYLEHLLI